VLFGAVCTVEKERFQSSAKGRCRLCSFQFSQQLVPRSRWGGGKCSIRPFSDLSVGRRSLRDWRPAVMTGIKWPRLAGACPWYITDMSGDCPSDALWTRKHSIRYVVLAEHNWCGHVAWGRAGRVPPHTGHAVTVPKSMLRDQQVLRCSNRGVTVRERRPIVSWRLGRADDALSVDGVSERSTSAPVARCGRASITLRRSEHQDSEL